MRFDCTGSLGEGRPVEAVSGGPLRRTATGDVRWTERGPSMVTSPRAAGAQWLVGSVAPALGKSLGGALSVFLFGNSFLWGHNLFC
jgi:hypothetical protein